MPRVTVRGVELCYQLQEVGPRLLFINGTGSDLRVRPSVFDSPLAAHVELLAFDHRGLGRSSTPALPTSMADYADDAAALMTAIGWSDAAVVGASFGGMVAQELTLRHPERVSCLVLACTSSGGAGGSSYPLHELQELPVAERLERALLLADTRHDRAWREANDALLAPVLAQQSALLEGVERDPERARGQRFQLQARRGHDTWTRLGSIACPTLVAAGRYDGIAPLSNSENLTAAIPDSRLEVFEGGHGFLMEDPRAWPAVAEFVVSNARRGSSVEQPGCGGSA